MAGQDPPYVIIFTRLTGYGAGEKAELRCAYSTLRAPGFPGAVQCVSISPDETAA